MEKEIIIVTAFFDIGRANIPGFQRSVDKYFENFSFWARIKNRLIVFCEPQNADKVRAIRKSFGLEQQTQIVEVQDFYACEGDLHEKMLYVEKHTDFASFRWNDKDISNTANYDYVQFLKYYCLKEAAMLLPANEDCYLSWVDFGYNSGGKHYLKAEEFDFQWQWNFKGRINVFAFNDPAVMSITDSLQFETDCLMGGVIIVEKEYCHQLHDYMLEMMESLINIECIDDDQHLLLMVYKKHREDFNIIMAKGWFDAFTLCSNQQFTIRKPATIKKTNKLVREVKRVLHQATTIGQPKRKYEADFMLRMQEKAKRYHR